MPEKTFNFEDRLVQFAGNMILFVKTLPKDDTGKYYGNQMMRSAGSSVLNYGEAQGTITDKDFIHKMSVVLKELKETKVSLRVLDFVDYRDTIKRKKLLQESKELAAISATIILNKKNKGRRGGT